MPFNGSGTYNPPGADFPAVAGTLISATKFNNVINDIATALSNCVTRDGQSPLTAAFNGGGQVLTNLGAGTAALPAVRFAAGGGLYSGGANIVGIATNGSARFTIDAAGLAALLAGSLSVYGLAGDTTKGNLWLNTAGTVGVQNNATNLILVGLPVTVPNGGVTANGLLKGNNGGSGLGAITISTSAPSGGASGDLWLRY